MTQQYGNPDRIWREPLEKYNQQMELVLEWDMRTEKALEQFRMSKSLLEIIERVGTEDNYQKMYNELETKVEEYEERIIDSYISEDNLDYNTIEVNDNSFNPDPPSAV